MSNAVLPQPSDGGTNVAGDDAELQRTLEQLLWRAMGRPVDVTSISRQRSEMATRAPVEILNITLADGQTLRLFLKQCGGAGADAYAQEREQREFAVYEHLFADEPAISVPRYFGSRRNPATSTRELFLEHVDGLSLLYQPLDRWFLAARELARLHRHFVARVNKLLACPYLLRLDEACHMAWARRALEVTSQRSSELAAQLEPLVASYQPVARLLCPSLPTLVHNDLGRRNVLVSACESGSARIVFIDWESAGIGLGLHDLVHLRLGRLDEQTDRRVIEIYREELADTELLPRTDTEVTRLIRACELHRIVYRLARSIVWNKPIADVALRVRQAAELWQQVR